VFPDSLGEENFLRDERHEYYRTAVPPQKRVEKTSDLKINKHIEGCQWNSACLGLPGVANLPAARGILQIDEGFGASADGLRTAVVHGRNIRLRKNAQIVIPRAIFARGICFLRGTRAKSGSLSRFRGIGMTRAAFFSLGGLFVAMQLQGKVRESGSAFCRVCGAENENGDAQSESPPREVLDDGSCAAMARLNSYQPHRP
jgi:hypothetical protein